VRINQGLASSKGMKTTPMFQRAFKQSGKIAFAIGLLVSSATAVLGDDNHWTGAGGDMFWTNSANWSLGVLPDSSQNVFIGNTDTNPVVLNTAATVGNFSLGGTNGMAILNVDGGSLHCFNSGQVSNHASLNLNGTLMVESLGIQGQLVCGGGQFNLSGDTVVSASGSVVVQAGAAGTLHSSLVNNGTITCFATHLLFASGFQFANNQTLVLHSNLTLAPVAGANPFPSFQNTGTIAVPEGDGVVRLTLGIQTINTGSLVAGSNAVLELATTNNGAFAAQDGSVFGGAGVVRFVEGTGDVTCDGWMNVNGIVELDGATIDGTSPWSVFWGGAGLFRWLGGTLGEFHFMPGLEVTMSGPGEKIIKGICSNEGEVYWQSVGPLLLSTVVPTDFQNITDIILETNCTMGIQAGGFENPRFENYGSIRVPADRGTVSLNLGARMNGEGTFWAGSNAVLEVGTTNNGLFEIWDEAVFDGEGVVRFVAGTGDVTFGHQIFVNGTLEWSGANTHQTYQQTEWRGSGQFRWLSGSLSGFWFFPGLHVELVGPGEKILQGDCANYGEIHWRSEGPLLLSSTDETSFENHGEFILETNCMVGIKPGGFQGAVFENRGTLRVPADQGTVSLSVGAWLENWGTIWAGSNTTLEVGTTNNGLIDLVGFSTIDGDGVLRLVEGSGEINSAGVLVNGTVELAGANISGFGGSWFGPGLFRWLSGSIGFFTFDTDFHVEVSGPGEKIVEWYCNNLGEVRWLSEGPMLLATVNDSTFVNSGTFILETNCTVGVTPGGFQNPYFQNSGTVQVSEGQGAVSLMLGGQLINYGTLWAGSNAVLEVGTTNNGLFLAQDGTVFGGEGVVRFGEGIGDVNCEGGMTVNGTVELDGAQIHQSSQWTGPGLFRWLSGSLGNFTFAPGFHVEMSGWDNKGLEGTCTNLGEVRWLQDSFLSIRSGSAASFVNGGLFSQEVGGSWHDGIVISNLVGGTFLQKAGKFWIGPFDNKGTLRMTGGILNPDPGIKFHPGSTCHFVLGGTSTMTNQGRISFGLIESIASSQTTLDGKLLVTLTNGFVPAVSTDYLMIWDGGWGVQFVGQFNQTDLPPLQSNLVWHVAYTAGFAILRTVLPPGLTGTTLLPDGSFQFSLTGSAGGNFEIQASTNLVDWQTVTNGSFAGSVIYTDLAATNYTRRFYRGRLTE
jgi:hypothetical protein